MVAFRYRLKVKSTINDLRTNSVDGYYWLKKYGETGSIPGVGEDFLLK
jgi:hypothetical protein